MFNYINRKKGQSTLEYAVLIIIIIGALLSIQVYIKRGIQGRLKSATDDIGDQFSPGNTKVNKIKGTNSFTNQTFIEGEQKTTLLETENSVDFMNSSIINVQREYWGGK